MSKRKQQSEKLFSNQELTNLLAKTNQLELMTKIEKSYGLGKIFNNTNYEKTKAAIHKLVRPRK
jgi:hypothetical protein